jgi:D-glutamate cyclase
MTSRSLNAIRDLIQEDIGRRGLRADSDANLITACPRDFENACHSIAATPQPVLAVVTGFLIPKAQPPAAETDGPLGALFLVRALSGCGAKVILAADDSCQAALRAGLVACGLERQVSLLTLPTWKEALESSPQAYWQRVFGTAGRLTHLVALERVGPSHTPESVFQQSGGNERIRQMFGCEVPPANRDRYQTLRGQDVTDLMSPAHWLFELAARQQPVVSTIGIGDGGNEIGMGKIPWEVIHRNIPGGGKIACRVATDYLIVAGISNWGAYGLATGVRSLLGLKPDGDLYDPGRERELLFEMVEKGPLVDGLLGTATVSVDGIEFDRYVELLARLGRSAFCKTE